MGEKKKRWGNIIYLELIERQPIIGSHSRDMQPARMWQLKPTCTAHLNIWRSSGKEERRRSTHLNGASVCCCSPMARPATILILLIHLNLNLSLVLFRRVVRSDPAEERASVRTQARKHTAARSLDEQSECCCEATYKKKSHPPTDDDGYAFGVA